MYNLLVNTLFLFFKDPETVHRLSIRFLQFLGTPPLQFFSSSLFSVNHPSLKTEVFGITFKNPIGLAGGFDKNAEAVPGLSVLGFGFLELGSVTSKGQTGNPRQRIFRLEQDRAVINRMGFNNHGQQKMKERLERLSPKVPLGISLGKQKEVELKDAPEEYLSSYTTLYEYGDYFVVNVSSPNTPGLRELQDKDSLIAIVDKLNTYRKQQGVAKPLLVKIAPDLTFEAIDEVLSVCIEHDVDGIIATNTTLSREGLSAPIEEMGGMSGAPLKKRATEVIAYIHKKTPILPIIGVGGIFTAEDVYEKIKAGASLVQIYTGFIYGGPFTVKDMANGLAELLKKDGFTNVKQAVGIGI